MPKIAFHISFLGGKNKKLKKSTLIVQQFAGDGLRTLCLAYRDLDEAFFFAWKKRHLEASRSFEHREEKFEALYNEIEHDMTLLGESFQSRIFLFFKLVSKIFWQRSNQNFSPERDEKRDSDVYEILGIFSVRMLLTIILKNSKS